MGPGRSGGGETWHAAAVVVGKRRSPSKQRGAETRVAHSPVEAKAKEEARLVELLAQNMLLQVLG